MELPRFGGYRVLSELGSGAISTVYKATQEPLGRKVAIKALKPTILPSSSFAAQLEREARVLAGLSHPNIVLCFDFVKTDAQMYLVLEYIGGFTLAEIITKKPKLRPEMVAAIGHEVARGLAHAHERGVIHRDVKPANVILSRRGEVKLVDFSIAHRERLPTADEPLGEGDKSAALGTPAYMAPEQLLGETQDARSDLFSLGVVLYQLLAGERPFERAGERRDAGHAARIRPAVPLRERAPDVPRALERLVMRCIEKLPADRPTSAEAVAAELESFLHARTEATVGALVRATLASARLLPGEVATLPVPRPEARRPFSERPVSMLAFTALLVLGLTVVRVADRGSAQAAPATEGALEPAQRGYLRVLATPWAEVSVDGQLVDVTPFARSIPLAPGTHFVTLTHPAAPAETRRVVIEPDKTVLLDVTMNLQHAPPSDVDAGAGAEEATP